MAAAHLELRAVIQYQHVIAPAQLTKLLYTIKVDYRATMNPPELLRIKVLLDGFDR